MDVAVPVPVEVGVPEAEAEAVDVEVAVPVDVGVEVGAKVDTGLGFDVEVGYDGKYTGVFVGFTKAGAVFVASTVIVWIAVCVVMGVPGVAVMAKALVAV